MFQNISCPSEQILLSNVVCADQTLENFRTADAITFDQVEATAALPVGNEEWT